MIVDISFTYLGRTGGTERYERLVSVFAGVSGVKIYEQRKVVHSFPSSVAQHCCYFRLRCDTWRRFRRLKQEGGVDRCKTSSWKAA